MNRLHYEQHHLPLVDFVIIAERGAYDETISGVTGVMAHLLRRGPASMTSKAFEKRLLELGAQMSVSVGMHSMRMHFVCLERNFDTLLALISELLSNPAFRKSDFRYQKRRTLADLAALADEDRSLSSFHNRVQLFAGHPYSKSMIGQTHTIPTIKIENVHQRFETLFQAQHLWFGACASLSPSAFKKKIAHYFPVSTPKEKRAPFQKAIQRKGRHVRIVDRKDRSQTQIQISTMSVAAKHKDSLELMIANSAFGSGFSSRLLRAIRVDRGWSYDVGSQHVQGLAGGNLRLWAHPQAEVGAACLAQMVDELEKWRQDLRDDEVADAKRMMIAGHCFDVDTSAKRLHIKIDSSLGLFSKTHAKNFVSRVEAVQTDQVRSALRRQIDPNHLAITLVGDADSLEREIEKVMPGMTYERVEPKV